MLLLNRPDNDSVGLQQHAAVLQNTRNAEGILSRFGEDDLRGRKTFSLLLEAFDAENLGADGLSLVRNDAVGGRTVLIVCGTTRPVPSSCPG